MLPNPHIQTAEPDLFGLAPAPVKSPLNYTGGKYRMLPQLLPHFPEQIGTFVDLFTGGCNVGINVTARHTVCNDIIPYVIDIYRELRSQPKEQTWSHIDSRIKEYSLSADNEEGYRAFRDEYNRTRRPLDLYILAAHSFNYQIRFNSRHEYNNPFGRANSTFNAVMRRNLDLFIERLQQIDIEFTSLDFTAFDTSALGPADFVYCDPPYLITSAAYNDGRRGFRGWGDTEERQLLDLLDSLDTRGVRFALSNVLTHKGKTNDLLACWLRDRGHRCLHLRKNYAASSYHTTDRSKTATDEVLITNYTDP